MHRQFFQKYSDYIGVVVKSDEKADVVASLGKAFAVLKGKLQAIDSGSKEVVTAAKCTCSLMQITSAFAYEVAKDLASNSGSHREPLSVIIVPALFSLLESLFDGAILQRTSEATSLEQWQKLVQQLLDITVSLSTEWAKHTYTQDSTKPLPIRSAYLHVLSMYPQFKCERALDGLSRQVQQMCKLHHRNRVVELLKDIQVYFLANFSRRDAAGLRDVTMPTKRETAEPRFMGLSEVVKIVQLLSQIGDALEPMPGTDDTVSANVKKTWRLLGTVMDAAVAEVGSDQNILSLLLSLISTVIELHAFEETISSKSKEGGVKKKIDSSSSRSSTSMCSLEKIGAQLDHLLSTFKQQTEGAHDTNAQIMTEGLEVLYFSYRSAVSMPSTLGSCNIDVTLAIATKVASCIEFLFDQQTFVKPTAVEASSAAAITFNKFVISCCQQFQRIGTSTDYGTGTGSPPSSSTPNLHEEEEERGDDLEDINNPNGGVRSSSSSSCSIHEVGRRDWIAVVLHFSANVVFNMWSRDSRRRDIIADGSPAATAATTTVWRSLSAQPSMASALRSVGAILNKALTMYCTLSERELSVRCFKSFSLHDLLNQLQLNIGNTICPFFREELNVSATTAPQQQQQQQQRQEQLMDTSMAAWNDSFKSLFSIASLITSKLLSTKKLTASLSSSSDASLCYINCLRIFGNLLICSSAALMTKAQINRACLYIIQLTLQHIAAIAVAAVIAPVAASSGKKSKSASSVDMGLLSPALCAEWLRLRDLASPIIFALCASIIGKESASRFPIEMEDVSAAFKLTTAQHSTFCRLFGVAVFAFLDCEVFLGGRAESSNSSKIDTTASITSSNSNENRLTTVNELYIYCHVYWATCTEMFELGTGDLIDKLKTTAVALDSDSNVLSLSSSSSSARSSASNAKSKNVVDKKAITITDIGPLLHTAVHSFRVWILLTMWCFPLRDIDGPQAGVSSETEDDAVTEKSVTNKTDSMSSRRGGKSKTINSSSGRGNSTSGAVSEIAVQFSDGERGSSLYMTNALRSLKRIEEYLSIGFVDVVGAPQGSASSTELLNVATCLSVCTILSQDCRLLRNMLTLHGRVKDEIFLRHLVRNIIKHCAVYCGVSGHEGGFAGEEVVLGDCCSGAAVRPRRSCGANQLDVCSELKLCLADLASCGLGQSVLVGIGGGSYDAENLDQFGSTFRLFKQSLGRSSGSDHNSEKSSDPNSRLLLNHQLNSFFVQCLMRTHQERSFSSSPEDSALKDKLQALSDFFIAGTTAPASPTGGTLDGNIPTTSTVFDSVEAFLSSVQNILKIATALDSYSAAAVSSSRGGNPFAFSSSVVTKYSALVCLVAAKLCFIVFGSTLEAHAWCKYTLRYLPSAKSAQRESANVSSSSPSTVSPISSSIALTTLSVGSALLKMETLLLIAELHEHAGNVEGSCAYLGEALALSKLGTNCLRNIVSLHALRMWYRMSSPRLITFIDEVLSVDDPYSRQEIRDDVSKDCRATTRNIVNVFRLTKLRGEMDENDDDDDGSNEDIMRLVGDGGGGGCGSEQLSVNDPSLIRYRYMDLCWDTTTTSSSSSSSKYRHVYMPKYLRNQVADYATALLQCDTSSPQAIIVPSNGDHDGSTSPHSICVERGDAMLKSIGNLRSFELLRDTRRRLCFDTVLCGSHSSETDRRRTNPICGGGDEDNDAQRAFLLGAASCGVSVECFAAFNVSNPSTPQSDVAVNGTTGGFSLEQQYPCGKIDAMSQLIIGATARRDANCIASVQRELHRILRHLSGGAHSKKAQPSSPLNSSGSGTIAFACLEDTSNYLLLGRTSSFNDGGDTGSRSVELVVALPLGEQSRALLNKWSKVQEEAMKLLQQSRDVETVSKWSEAQKRRWWAARDDSDSDIGETLFELQQLLGPYRILLQAQPPLQLKKAQSALQCISTLQESDFSYIKIPPSAKGKADGAAILDTWEQSAAAIDPWFQLVVSHLIAPKSANSLSIEEAVHILSHAVKSSIRSELSASVAKTEQQKQKLQDECVKIANQIITVVIGDSCKELLSDDMQNLSLSTPVAAPGDDREDIEASASPAATGYSSDELSSMKITELRSLIKEAKLSAVGKKSDLVERLLEHQAQTKLQHKDQSSESANTPSPTSSSVSGRTAAVEIGGNGHTVLLLDEMLQRIPWECMPFLRDEDVSRVPNLAMLLSLDTGGDGGRDDDGGGCNNTVSVGEKESKFTRKSSSSISSSSSSSSSSKKNATDEKEIGGKPLEERVVSLSRAWYALDMAGNLPATREIMRSFLDTYASPWKWATFIGSYPSEAELRRLYGDCDLFVYCGHGSGEDMVDSYKLRKLLLTQSDQQQPGTTTTTTTGTLPHKREVCAAMLWGCSSGKLETHGIHDPSGPALNYLLAGSPFVLGNLWDVTDKDIDKLSMQCMQSTFDPFGCEMEPTLKEKKKHYTNSVSPLSTLDGEGNNTECNSNSSRSVGSIAASLSSARKVCKLQHAVGCAPVIYGVPLKFSL